MKNAFSLSSLLVFTIIFSAVCEDSLMMNHNKWFYYIEINGFASEMIPTEKGYKAIEIVNVKDSIFDSIKNTYVKNIYILKVTDSIQNQSLTYFDTIYADNGRVLQLREKEKENTSSEGLLSFGDLIPFQNDQGKDVTIIYNNDTLKGNYSYSSGSLSGINGYDESLYLNKFGMVYSDSYFGRSGIEQVLTTIKLIQFDNTLIPADTLKDLAKALKVMPGRKSNKTDLNIVTYGNTIIIKGIDRNANIEKVELFNLEGKRINVLSNLKGNTFRIDGKYLNSTGILAVTVAGRKMVTKLTNYTGVGN